MNTDVLAPNFYTLSADGKRLSINGLQTPVDSLTTVPLGVMVRMAGDVIFECRKTERLPDGMFIYFCDRKTGAIQNLKLHPVYIARLEEGSHEGRFSLVFSDHDLRYQPPAGTVFQVYASGSRLYVYSDLPVGEQADLKVYDLMGNLVFRHQLEGKGYDEFTMEVSTGIYIATIRSSAGACTKKVYMTNQW
jgi:hypothetical protein